MPAKSDPILALLKPGKRLAKLIDPKCYIVTAPYYDDCPNMGVRFEVFDRDGKRIAHAQYSGTAWQVASIRLRKRVEAEGRRWAKELGLTVKRKR